ncbi:class D beta-lactamase [uncultured Tenacibaculum sp.]|uniref:class D beta-lactamase n=1 Tax=uncultured Tenacibaculum sp. TaxID=174713 RepID=UPI00260CA772|nr:class D beta-lactamase [uncultured Tenacibaculum sp.]
MKILRILFVFLLILSCKQEKQSKEITSKEESTANKEIVSEKFQKIIDEAKLKGSILIYDSNKKQFLSNDFYWARTGKLPASTYKIPNSIIALETSVVENDSTIFKWNGEDRRLKIWEQDLYFKQAFHYSCVPCYQEVARKIGVERMKKYLEKLNYGDIKVDSTNIDLFWLQGNSKITQFQQIDFLQRFYKKQLPISKRTDSIMKNMIVMKDKEGVKLSGKTGWSIYNNINNGWFVGYVEAKNNVFFFATNVEPTTAFDMKLFPKIRKEITFKAFENIGIYLN